MKKTPSRLRTSILSCIGCFLMLQGLAQDLSLFSKEQFIQNNDSLLYRMMLPKDFDASKTYPLVLFLHGAGERGNDNESQLTHGAALFASEDTREQFPAIVVFPQCPKGDYWANAEVDRSTKPITLLFPKDLKPTKSMVLAMNLLDQMLENEYVDKNQIYVGGLSMGAMGTFEMLSHKPETFAAAFAICGAGNAEATASYAKNTALWVFHGAHDDVVNPLASVEMVAGLLKNGGKPNFSLYAEDNHNSWDSAFAEPDLLPWLFSNSKD
ncbi:carboxylesterase family protein [Subsaximicrobium wynnwilliamsii]|nr:alpha/beta hydrolase-fold protein [Subsaximicrobium wynnwilliamsii]